MDRPHSADVVTTHSFVITAVATGARTLAVFAAILLGTAFPAHAEYRLVQGDVLEIAIAGMPEMRQRAPIQLDGTISIAGIGTLHVAGSSVASVQTKLEMMLATKSVRQRNPAGGERVVLMHPGDLAVMVAEYRPIYVSGDVLTPGQHAYRPTMTVRQALALSGGVSLVRSRGQASNTEAIDLDREYRTVAVDLAREQVRIWRIAAELANENTIEERGREKLPVPAASVAEFFRIETKYLQIRRSEIETEQAFLVKAVRQSDEQIAVLTVQEQQEQRGVQADQAELEKVTKLFGAGNLPSPRVTESRRAVLLSSTRRLQTVATLTQAKRQREDFVFRQEKLHSQRELDLVREMKESRARLSELRTKLQSAAEKLRVIGRAVSLEGLGENPRPEIIIIRKNGQQWEQISASENSELEPGDAIEVTLRGDHVTGLARR